jgi:hypothetical protein
MTTLHPAAQAVMIAATNGNFNVVNDPVYKQCIAAALRAAADQVVPPEQERLFNEERPWDGELCAGVEIRQQLIAIATELETHQ